MRLACAVLLSAAAALGADCARTSTGFDPLNTPFFQGYQGMAGGLYPDGSPAVAAPEIRPLDRSGNPDPDGRIVLLSIGMSNTTQEFSVFQKLAAADPDKNPQVLAVDGAQGGWSADRVVGDPETYWSGVMNRLRAAGVTPAQVEAAWLKEADAGPRLSFPDDARRLAGELETIVRSLPALFPNLQIVYLSSRIYAGYATTGLNPEPYAYQGGFAVKWLIEHYLNGGLPRVPRLAWGPYLWADGTRRRFDGLTWGCSDVREDDGTHPSPAGQLKVATMLLDFLKSDPSAQPWFLKPREKAPQPKPEALVNAAGWFGPVAPGSIATLTGKDLAGDFYTADPTPLPHTLGGITVTIGGEPAPLYNVSPESICLLVPGAPRDNVLRIRRLGGGGATLQVDLAPDHPGLFTLDGRAAVAMHPDGSTVTPESPAARGEVIELLGTGKGVRNPAVMMPLFVPMLRVGEASAEIQAWTTGSVAPGMDQIRFIVPEAAASGDAVPLQIQVPGFQSNVVFLSVR